ncbi:hypothetical protein SynRS9909_00684 [Synechococcus sp. RS9909]|nr:hypothetical protein SynRS9909_00684 [Synechococcus sp. RS9909]
METSMVILFVDRRSFPPFVGLELIMAADRRRAQVCTAAISFSSKCSFWKRNQLLNC